MLRTGFTVLPIIMGLDKFFNLMVSWPQYLADDLVSYGELYDVAVRDFGLLLAALTPARPAKVYDC